MTDFTHVEELLSQSVSRSDKKFASTLRSRTLDTYDHYYPTAQNEKSRPRAHQVLGWAGLLTISLIIALIITPLGRALAQRILQYGWFIFTNKPTAVEQFLTSTPEKHHSPIATDTNLTEASKIAGFPVYYPSFLPKGYTPLAHDPNKPIEVLFNSSGGVLKVNAVFEQVTSKKILSFSQIRLDPAARMSPLEFGTGHVEPQFVIVSGNEGIWLPDFNWGLRRDERDNLVAVPHNLLIWEINSDDGYTFQFWLDSEERLPLDVMRQIAESISQ